MKRLPWIVVVLAVVGASFVTGTAQDYYKGLQTLVAGSGVSVPGLAGTSTTGQNGFILNNPTLSTGGVPVQMSPPAAWCGHVWNTAADETSCFWMENLPATAASPTGTMRLAYSRNGGAATYPMTVNSAGTASFAQSVAAYAAITVGTLNQLGWTSRAEMESPADGHIILENYVAALGSRLKFDALPTVSSGFGTTPGITAGSTPLAGSVNVGTGGVATSGVINFNGAAFPSAPFCTVTPSLTNVPTRPTTVSATQLTLTTSTAWTASDIIFYQCISAK